MQRTRLSFLKSWLKMKKRNPLVIRGARQVGKTWLVRQFAQETHKQLCEINFEKHPEGISLFVSNDPSQVLINLEATLGKRIDPNHSILFLDEIQAVPELFANLRWFAEDMPELPVIAAGSLLDIMLEKHSFSMPVGRVHYMHLEPMSFEEFLLAKGDKPLLHYLETFEWKSSFPQALHNKLTSLFREYLIVGGMPAAVDAWITESSPLLVNQIHHDLLATYRDDFAKYRGKIDSARLEEVMMAIPRMLGTKFMYKKVNPSVNTESVKQALELLEKAKICSKIYRSSANGLPLGAEIKSKFFKVIFLDVGLNNAALDLRLNQTTKSADLTLIHRGGIAEQVVGQLLKTTVPAYVEPRNYYWQREERGSNAEVDYIIQHDDQIVPVEVKAGSTGSLKSLHLFMEIKKLPLALRINGDLPTCTKLNFKGYSKKNVRYTLMSLPLYLCGQVHRLIDAHKP